MAIDLRADDPVPEIAQLYTARTSVRIAIEDAPVAHLPTDPSPPNQLVSHPIGITLPDPEADVHTVRSALEAQLEAVKDWPFWDGCTTYTVEERSFGLTVRPNHVVQDGTCQPYASPLDDIFLRNDTGAPLSMRPSKLQLQILAHSIRMENMGPVVIPVGGIALLDLLDSVLEEDRERPIVWHYIRGMDWNALRFELAGSTSADIVGPMPLLPNAPDYAAFEPTPADKARAAEMRPYMERTTNECLATVRAAIAANPNKNPETLEIHCVDDLQERGDTEPPVDPPFDFTAPASATAPP